MNAYSINAKNTGAILMGTTENGTQSFVPVFCIIHTTAASGIVTGFTYSIGTNSATYNNIISNTTSVGIGGLNLLQNNPVTAGAIIVPANTQVYLNIAVATIGTSQTFDAHLFGFYK